MPFADPEEKKAYMRGYRQRSIENGYGKWLYQKRALTFADAEYFRTLLEEILARDPEPEIRDLIEDALRASRKRWQSLGPSPGAALPKDKELPRTSLLRVVQELERVSY